MQVSWIEPDEVRALAALLHGTTSTGTGGGWDVQTLPDASQGPQQPLLPQAPEPVGSQAAPAQAPAAAQPQAPSADVVLIREKLRVIRDRAKQAGLIQDEPPVVQTSPPATAPLDAPMAPPAPSPLSQLPPLASLRPEPTAPAVQAPDVDPSPAPPEPIVSAPAPAASRSSGAPAFLPLEGPITERLENFARWASRFSGATEVLLADDHGDMLWGVPSHSSLIVSAILAVQQALRASAGSLQQPPNVLWVPDTEAGDVQVLPCSTRFGLVTIILVSAPELEGTSVAALREALVLSVEAGGS
ncbi:hypothetical protein DES53_101881 [Roseimicrobium gellanilyticum]|uniref:Roadblock/LC7 domain-containing protein n=1 Tax=Roseimicrobium gellanilyticum TaxID=748857 RepID=A0A366HUW7_9BACT|nr:hypothetical protein [Roseimicrobium gellanilyticum]RBP48081.1 hypothetical protein DES53_101881 [Roseimicrobium gellanilyticum]